MDAARATGKHVVRRDQESSVVLGVDRVTLEAGADEVVGDLRCLSPSTEFDAASTFSDEVVVDGQRVRVVDGEGVFEVDEPHSIDTKGVVGFGDVDARLAVDVAVLGWQLRAVRREVQPVDAEVRELDGADSWAPAPPDMEGGPV